LTLKIRTEAAFLSSFERTKQAGSGGGASQTGRGANAVWRCVSQRDIEKKQELREAVSPNEAKHSRVGRRKPDKAANERRSARTERYESD
jgi:hypothetical protein